MSIVHCAYLIKHVHKCCIVNREGTKNICGNIIFCKQKSWEIHELIKFLKEYAWHHIVNEDVS